MSTQHIFEALRLRAHLVRADEETWASLASAWASEDPEEDLALATARALDAHAAALAREDAGARGPLVGAARALSQKLCRATATLVMLNRPAQAAWARGLLHAARATPWSWSTLAAQLAAFADAVVHPVLARDLGPFDAGRLGADARSASALSRALTRVAHEQLDPSGEEHAERAEALQVLGDMVRQAPAQALWATPEDALRLDGPILRVVAPDDTAGALEELLSSRPGEDVFLGVCAEIDREMHRDALRTLEVVLPEVEDALSGWPPTSRGVNAYTRSWWSTTPPHPLARLGRVVEVEEVSRWERLAASDAALRFHASFTWPPGPRSRTGPPSRTETQEQLEAILRSDALEQTTRLRLSGFGRVVSSTAQQAEFAPEAVQFGPERARRIAGDQRLRRLEALGLVNMGVENGPMAILLDDPVYEDLRELELEGELGQRYYYYSILR
ncbi:MAG: hypothetical protein AAGI01_14355, partial [Myxococcota bacterium]